MNEVEILLPWWRIGLIWVGLGLMIVGISLRKRGPWAQSMYLLTILAAALSLCVTIRNAVIQFNLPPLDYWMLLSLTIPCVLTDAELTKRGLYLGGKEINPFMCWLIGRYGYRISIPVAIGGCSLLGVFLCNAGHNSYPYFLPAIYLVVLMSNAVQLYKLKRRRSRALVVIKEG